ncbi:MAG: transcription elongation factor GreA [bacterium]|nr:transcription elongation factor GreA [bacterium]
MKHAYLTKERFEEIEKEVRELKTDGRRRIAERLKQAKDLGDLSENFDYQTARDEQANLEQRISQLDDILRTSSIITSAGSAAGMVKIGSTVTAERDRDTVTYTITGSSEAQPGRGLISNESPIGRSLLGKRVGDEVHVTTPRGAASLRILSIT